ncbi:MAG: hypothetical protein WBL27_07885 [Salinimicrobium sp.]
MKRIKTNRMNLINLSFYLCLILFLAACSDDNSTEDEPDDTGSQIEFPSYQQDFSSNVLPWGDKDTGEEEAGWCGTIVQTDGTDAEIAPSAGTGFATVRYGGCNTYWTENGFADGSGPATLDPTLFSQTWPENGFVHQLDVYLNPEDFEDGMAFMIWFGIYYDALDYPFIYFGVNVDKQNGNLLVNSEYEVTDAGWFTFKQTYNKGNDGKLMVDFELQNDSQVVYQTGMSETIAQEPTSSYNIDDIYANGNVIGSGYMWFPAIASGVELAIDEYELRPL